MNNAWLIILGISIANNLDNTGVGIAYGIARIRIAPLANLWISIITLAITGGAVICGGAATHFLPGRLPNVVSATILCAVGLWILYPALRQAHKANEWETTASLEEPGRFSLKRILEDPRRADRDGSRHIDFFEATLLGVALSINNIGGGLSAGLLHLSAPLTALWSAAISFVVIWLGGLLSGRRIGGRLNLLAPYVSGTLLIAIGLFELR